jgi:DNA-binding NarL/FixJ family response regulator
MRSEAIRTVVADDREAVRAGLRLLLEGQPDMDVVGEAASAAELLGIVKRRRPHVVVCASELPGAGPADLWAIRRPPEAGAALVVFTACTDPARIEEALEAGVAGWVLMTSPQHDLVRAVREAHAGRRFVDATLAAALIGRGREEGRSLLTPREREVLQHLADGLTTDLVATQLYLAPATVRSYAESAMQKLESRNRAHAVAKALRLALIE